MKLEALTLYGYKSIEKLSLFKFRDLNVLIGANGAGKSNLLSLFRLAETFAEGDLQMYVQKQGGPDALLFGGRKRTTRIDAEFYFGPGNYQKAYKITLEPTVDNRLIFQREEYHHSHSTTSGVTVFPFGTTHQESRLPQGEQNDAGYIFPTLQNLRLYHFQDTSDTAKVKQPHQSNDNLRLKPDAANLAAFLVRLHNEFPSEYKRIVETVRLAAPFFGDFVVRDPLPQAVELEWTERGDSDTPYRAHVLSDGTLRFICLTTLLLQPHALRPDTVLIDEPELGLHPYAINLLAEMLKQASADTQVIVSTQSVELLNNFAPEDVIVTNREDGASTFRRLDGEALKDWLEDYTLGELWKKNILGGRPSRT